MEHKFEPFERVLVRDTTCDLWKASLFSHMNGDNYYVCINGPWEFCIPYWSNEHLLGTTDSPEPKHEYQWGDKVEVMRDNRWSKALYYIKNVTGHNVYFCGSNIHIEDNEIRPLKEDK